MKTPTDKKARDEALDPRRSFIVQAPAGSGKTELLTRRFLGLLAGVEQPEEIVAITFTRKAAAEMRHRILKALDRARGDAPEEGHQRELWQLARRALERDEERSWALLDNPGRLRIQTIDSLCSGLARRLPILSRLGSSPELVEDARPLLREAARRTAQALEGDPQRPIVIAASVLYEHLDGEWRSFEELLVAQLAQRDQWMGSIFQGEGGAPSRRALEGALQEVIGDELKKLQRATPPALEAALPAVARAAARNLKQTAPDAPIVALEELESMPGVAGEDLLAWRGIAALLLTGTDTLRKRLTKNEGLPAKSPEKAAMVEVLAPLSDSDLFVKLLGSVRRLPAPRYSDTQWRVLEALIVVLKDALAQLRLVFAETAQVDFVEVAQAALLALGEEQAPTDLALMLDQQIRHLLVDEYQDTSFSQLTLLQRLTAGWESGDGRTLFLVGDPMQSIYRFREAEVGLFLRAKKDGVGDLRLTSLRLEENFRSQQGLVEWVNAAFPDILPKDDDVEVGAVSYSPSSAYRAPSEGSAVHIHPSLDNDKEAEAEAVATLIADRLEHEEAQRDDCEPSEKPKRIAVLARARHHLYRIAAKLTQRGVPFQALDVDPLSERPAVSDLLALTRALSDLGDRLAWFAVLRAPFCGLELADLSTIAETPEGISIWSRLGDAGVAEALSGSGRERVARLRGAVGPALGARRRRELRRWVEGVWLALGGPATLSDAGAAEAEAYFRLLERHAAGRTLVDLARLEEAVAELFAPPDPQAADRVQLMTMHKAKGLEFEIVILPALGRKTGQDKKVLLRSIKRSLPGGRSALLLAPVREAREEEEAIYDHLRLREQAKADNEAGRLLYVACTRAREELHLFGHAPIRKSAGDKSSPESASLLRHLWPAVKGAFSALEPPAEDDGGATEDGDEGPKVMLQRLKADWRPQPLPDAPLCSPVVDKLPLGAEARPEITFDWASPIAASVGTVVHRYLERFAAAGLPAWPHATVAALKPAIEANLRSLGLSGEELKAGRGRVLRALHNVVDDERAAWILDPAHREARSELALTARLDGDLVNVIIDRTFVEGGVRWIIDYKTSSHEGGKLEDFLDNEQVRYGEQLERYGRVFARRGDERIRLALYFPLLAAWRAWDYRPAEA